MKFQKGAAVVYFKKDCYVLLEWDPKNIDENMKFINAKSLNEKPRFELKSKIEEGKNDLVKNLMVSMECDTNKRNSHSLANLRNGLLQLHFTGKNCIFFLINIIIIYLIVKIALYLKSLNFNNS